MSEPRIITPAERAARNAQRTGKPIAQFRVKGGCRTCNPVPVYPRQPPANPLPDTHANATHPSPG